jgi:hypothetical protein
VADAPHMLRLGANRVTAHRWVDRAPVGWVLKIGAPTRTDEQNRKLWPMLEDLRRQVPGLEGFTRDDMKLRFLNQLGAEMRFLPELEGQGLFPVGLKSSTLTKEQFSGLIELIYKYGAKYDVVWTEPKGQGE